MEIVEAIRILAKLDDRVDLMLSKGVTSQQIQAIARKDLTAFLLENPAVQATPEFPERLSLIQDYFGFHKSHEY